MSGVWAVLARETNERRSVMLAALAFGLLPLVAGAAAGVARWGGADVRDDLALVVESDDTQRIQETHNLVGHVLCDLVERMLFQSDE